MIVARGRHGCQTRPCARLGLAELSIAIPHAPDVAAMEVQSYWLVTGQCDRNKALTSIDQLPSSTRQGDPAQQPQRR
jgi:hypothetical protein